MNWSELADQLARGQKAYEAFQDGTRIAQVLGGIERARNELQAQYDALPGKIAQANADLAAIGVQADQARAEEARRASVHLATLHAAHAQHVAEAQAEMDTWHAKLTAMAQDHEAQVTAAQEKMRVLRAQIGQLTEQVASLAAAKADLKAHLQAQLQTVT